MREGVHLNEVDPAVRAAELILDAALQPEFLGLEGMGQHGHLVRRQPTAGQRIQRTDECDRNGGRGTGGSAGRCSREDVDLEGHIVRNCHDIKCRLDQRVLVVDDLLWIDSKPFVEVLQADDNAIFCF